MVRVTHTRRLAHCTTCPAVLEIDVEVIDNRYSAVLGFTGEDYGINQP
jgi:hypothetical protein